MRTLGQVALVLHPRRDSTEAVDAVLGWAAERACRVVGLPDEVDRLGTDVVPVTADELGDGTDLLVSLGGDGTMLRSLRLARRSAVPVLGVNLGRLGFLADVDVPELGPALGAIAEGRFTVENRVAVEVRCPGGSGARGASSAGESVTHTAFNDVALLRHPGHSVGAVEVLVDGHRFVRYAADAVIVATPTGSTAYSFSAGGPVVSPRAEGLLVTPVAPHSAFNRAVFLSRDERLELRLLDRSGPLSIEVDGELVGTVGPGESVEVDVCAQAGRVVRLGTTTFYQRVRRKLRLADPAELDAYPVLVDGQITAAGES